MFDIECARDRIIEILQANLPAKIAAINAEKGDGNNISDINAAHWYEVSDASEFNASPFVYYNFENVVDDNAGNSLSVQVRMNIRVVFVYKQDGRSYEDLAFRYTRAFKEILKDNFKNPRLAYLSSLEIQELLPETSYENETDAWSKQAGVQLRFHMT